MRDLSGTPQHPGEIGLMVQVVGVPAWARDRGGKMRRGFSLCFMGSFEKMLHLEDGVSMKKVVPITKARVIELWGEEVYVTCGSKRQV